MQIGYRSLFGLRACSALAVLTALTCAASARDSVALAEPNSSVSTFVPMRDPFSRGLPRLKTLKGSSERPLAIVTDLQGKERKFEPEGKVIGITGTLERPLLIVTDLQGKERKVEPKGKVIEVKVMLGDFWCPGEFERLCKQLRLERKVQRQKQ